MGCSGRRVTHSRARVVLLPLRARLRATQWAQGRVLVLLLRGLAEVTEQGRAGAQEAVAKVVDLEATARHSPMDRTESMFARRSLHTDVHTEVGWMHLRLRRSATVW